MKVLLGAATIKPLNDGKSTSCPKNRQQQLLARNEFWHECRLVLSSVKMCLPQTEHLQGVAHQQVYGSIPSRGLAGAFGPLLALGPCHPGPVLLVASLHSHHIAECLHAYSYHAQTQDCHVTYMLAHD